MSTTKFDSFVNSKTFSASLNCYFYFAFQTDSFKPGSNFTNILRAASSPNLFFTKQLKVYDSFKKSLVKLKQSYKIIRLALRSLLLGYFNADHTSRVV